MGVLTVEQSRRVAAAKKKAVMPPEPPHVGTPHPAELGVMVVCNPCGSIIKAQWVVREEYPKQAILCVEKCRCDSGIVQVIDFETRLSDIRTHPERHKHSFEALTACCMFGGSLHSALMDAHPELGRNGEQKCDVVDGPCSCGGWHSLPDPPEVKE